MRMVGGLAIVLGVLLGGPAHAVERTEFAKLVNAFDTMALHDKGFVTKWMKTPAFRAKSTLRPSEDQALAYAFGVIEKNTGLAIERHDDRPAAEISLELGDLGDRYTALGPAGAVTRAVWSLYGGRMRTAAITVRADYYQKDIYYFNQASAHELMHAIGFPGHAQGFDSISSYVRPVLSYTAWDEFFMRVLYDRRLTPGMPRVFALPLACRVMQEMLVAEHNQLVPDLAASGEQPYCKQLAALTVEAKDADDQYRIARAYARGIGTAKNLEQAKIWAKRAADQGNQQAKKLMDELVGLVSPGQQVALKTPEVGTVFRTARGGFTVTRVDGATVDTLNGANEPFSWRGLFYGREIAERADPVEQALATFWPLELGKTLTVELRAGQAPDSPLTARTEIKVLRAELVTVGKRAVPTVVVERHLYRPATSPDVAPYDGTFTYWYAPEYGFHMKYTYAFTGPSSGKPQNWTVQEVRRPAAH